ncbi:hypothetical protein HDF16_004773 [Granulicella aggregans]|uniref:Glycosyl hydrolase family 43 n=1 Tax=Granulicella aggregans TaxID=474949 RepID=A0A7W7ZHL6_9BACT|nr:hypothetical protein [Granulicella aggregans]MBB5060037.1 hypothetical protein [Granulicella aggregans]
MSFLVSGIALGCGSASNAVAPPNPVTSTWPVGIQPATQVVVNTSGYFPDPLPIHYGPGTTGALVFSSSDKKLMSCTEPVSAGCFFVSSYTISTSAFAKQAAAVGSTFVSIGNNNSYQDNNGNWQMATTVMLTNPSQTADPTWSVIAHTTPTNTGSPVPTAWTVDTLLIGSLSTTQKANYDGKYFEDGGSLYLLYSEALTTSPLNDGVVAQGMISATQVSSTPPQTLIAPETANGGFNSEDFFDFHTSTFKLVETGNITLINGKYVLAYSTGNFQEPNYKAGLAWSDTFLPANGGQYQKAEFQDTSGLFSQGNHSEGYYLLQNQINSYPNYETQVLAPGVPSVLLDSSGNYYMFFAGYDPNDHPLASGSSTDYDGSHRRPYFVKLDIAVPSGTTVAATPNTSLDSWIKIASQ